MAYRALDLKGIGEEGRAGNDDCGGSEMRGIDISAAHSFAGHLYGVARLVVSWLWLGDQELCTVVASFVGWIPRDGNESALEEGVIDDVALVIFALDDPVTGKDFALAGVGEDEGGICALLCVYQKGSAGAEGAQSSSPVGVVRPTRYISSLRS
jgi:hypothetical protein